MRASAPGPRPQPHQNPWVWLFALGVLVVVGLLVYLAVAAGDDGDERAAGETTAVPQLVGLTAREAVAELEDAGLRAALERAPSDEPANRVIDHDPAAGVELGEGETVRVVLSVGPASGTTGATTTTDEEEDALVAAPALVGLNYVDAHEQVEAAGLVGDSRPVESDEPRGTVVAQSPAPGSEIATTRHVKLSVSMGAGEREAARVPDVTGPKAPRARQIAIELGFTVLTADRDAPTAEEVDEVILQEPAAGTAAPVLTQITLYVGR